MIKGNVVEFIYFLYIRVSSSLMTKVHNVALSIRVYFWPCFFFTNFTHAVSQHLLNCQVKEKFSPLSCELGKRKIIHILCSLSNSMFRLCSLLSCLLWIIPFTVIMSDMFCLTMLHCKCVSEPTVWMMYDRARSAMLQMCSVMAFSDTNPWIVDDCGCMCFYQIIITMFSN